MKKSTDVLIIEPDTDLATVIGIALKRKGLRCEAVASAQEAIKKADKNKPRLIIMELLLPRHNGLEFIHEFRSYADWLDIPIIVYSNVSSEELAAEDAILQELGVVRHFYKPTTSLEDLTKATESALALSFV